MDEITIKRSQDPEVPGRQILHVAGTATIGEAFLLREALMEALEAVGDLRVDLSGVTGIDITGLQLLCAAHQSAEKSGKHFEVHDNGNEVFRKVVADAGFQRHVGCACDITSSCIWVGGEN
ncbi:MAG: sulfate transporter [Geobacteraceae bacterium GWC2_58_44]|nr:MAG: sulfate transporter [Geobacteraceae bacterium GWC2_58_44]